MNVVAVLVLYKTDLKNSPTYNSLIKASEKNGDKNLAFKLIVYNNGPIAENHKTNEAFEYDYVHDKDNGGVVAAYNYAFRYATQNNYDWMLLLDQDTVLPQNFFESIISSRRKISSDSSIVAIVPKITCNNLVISPTKVLFGGRQQGLSKEFCGQCRNKITAINSTTLLRVDFLSEIGGFNELFKLDFLDHWFFHMIYTHGKYVYVTESVVEHELSVMNYNEHIKPDRYISILEAESLFYKLYRSKIENAIYVMRLFVRSIKRYIGVKDKEIALLTIKHCWHTLRILCKL